MRNRKNVDQLFRDKFHGATADPPGDAWDNIASRLQQKKKNPLFFWYRAAGVAAALLLLFSLISEDGNGNDPKPVIVVGQPSVDLEKDSSQSQSGMQQNKYLLDRISQRRDDLVSEGTSVDLSQQPPKDAPETPTLTKTAPSTLSSGLSSMGPVKENVISLAESGKLAPAGTVENLEKIDKRELPVATTTEPVAGGLMVSTRITPLYLKESSARSMAPSGENALSYGLALAYRVNENFSIRSGINSVDVSYSAPDMAGLTSVQMVMPTPKSEAAILATPEVSQTQKNLQLLEIPLEVEYSLLDQRLHVDLIGGGSVFVLNKNSAEEPLVTTFSPSAPQLNELNITTNIGLGLGYQVSEKLEIRMEPMFKIQINKFDPQTSLSPHYFGIYSGFNYRF